MKSKLVLIEGLPGSGKTTTAQVVHEILTEMNLTSRLFLEGNLDHPADYDGVAHFTKNEFAELLSTFEKHRDLLSNRVVKQDNNYFLAYRKLKNEYGASFPDELLHASARNDVYELPLDQNRKLIAERWKKFADSALKGSGIFVFDCCFIQNPVTIGMIKYGAQKEDVISYVAELAAIAERLNPLLIYVEQNDLDHSFRKAVAERPKEWSGGFIEYYTTQGYGKKHGHTGLEGTLQVLQARRKLEAEIFSGLKIAKQKVNNSSYDINEYKQVIAEILSQYFSPAT
ncbi:hypothetical protein AMQ84_06560 [Paenibacillus riograndensis]|uniref:Group-specific protein n=1 Tax=Paenibacillus riograndensis TaxID=483937 RepID=A0A132U7J0_9BACL|nr:hypothetical protein [Paenibacillus riograndensis]KWX79599.1 hypothetical protein AMQ84_06560 [Paenibacillus riograndensis]KWX86189.1 hypothetical protein AMQ83_20365 [Paenibacillus riograndensis]